jgi:glyoxylase-like metal-dependent hydrolase (beta-lactamase superfamily II)
MKDPQIKVLSHGFQQNDSIASFLLPSPDGNILIESGPESTFNELCEALGKEGCQPEDIRHVLLTHIHFDHAGAAWKFAELGAKIYVHPAGLPHLADPSKLRSSAAQIYGDLMEPLWGRMQPIEKDKLVPVDDGDEIAIGGHRFKVHYTPGHAVHHNAYQLGNVLFTGDVCGIKINGGPVQPPCPPPDIDIGLWIRSLHKLAALGPEALYLTHFGRHDDPQRLFAELEETLLEWKRWMEPHYRSGRTVGQVIPEFVAYTDAKLGEAGLNDGDRRAYASANPAFMSVAGLYRYFKLKEEGRL